MGLAVSRQEAFWEACGFGDKIQVKKFIAEGIDVDWVSYTHNSCAIHVASQGKMEIVNMLLAAKCNVNAKDDRHSTALHQASMMGHSDIIEVLIKAGAMVDAQDKNGWTPLISAAYFCQLSAVKTLLKHGASVTLQNQDQRSALHEGCRSYSYLNEDHMAAIADLLISAGSDINSKSSDRGEADFTPLMFCAYHNHPKMAQALINAGCDINAQGSNLWSALHWASDRGHLEVAKVLIMSGIDVLLKGVRDELAVDRANSKEMYKLLHNCVEGASYNFHDPNRNAQEKLRDFSEQIFQKADNHKNIVDKQLQLLDDDDSSHSACTLSSTGERVVSYRHNGSHRYSSNSANRMSLILNNSVSPLNAPPPLHDPKRHLANGLSGKKCNGASKGPIKFIGDEDDDIVVEKTNGFVH